MFFLKFASHFISNVPGWQTTRKIVVFESDDWGSIRMPTREVYDQLLQGGVRVDGMPYLRYDSLAGEEDLSALFNILSSFKGKDGLPVVFTANTVVANPDFQKILGLDFTSYHYEVFTETLSRYPGCSGSFDLWVQGMNAGLFYPQFHGREHLNVPRWLRALQEDRGDVRMAFDYGMYDLSTSLTIGENSYMEALNLEDNSEIGGQVMILKEGLDLFEQLFGYRSRTFIAPCYTWSSLLEFPLRELGIEAFQGSWFQLDPMEGKAHQFRRRFHYIGQRNHHGQRYLVRNASFEPSQQPDRDWIEDILNRITIAFRLGKPVIIGTHRLNYIGAIDPANRDRNLVLLHRLLKKMIARWPEIEFMSSDQLVSVMNGNQD